MDFLDIFVDDDISNAKLKNKNNIDRKRKLDNFLEEYVDKAVYTEEKRVKIDIPDFKNPLSDLTIKTITTTNCTHEVVYPKSLTYKPLTPRNSVPAKVFKFTLDAFQNQAVQCIENYQSVLVSAHTSAGKTVCASYTIAQCIKENRRVIYTTPIKALSNQKYREFKEEFEDVGLLTGDVSIDMNASVLIMTTEILRLMLYRNSSIIKEVGWVIYDEIHYMRDKSRGVVWEESLILLPSTIRMVFLSATIPNARQFAQWISHIHGQPCNVIYTDYRPTPLQHYIYPNGADKIFQVVNENGEFLDSNFNESMAELQKLADNSKNDMEKRGRKGGSLTSQNHCQTLVKKIFELNKDPVIVFSFSKKHCENYAKMLSKLDYTTSKEKENIELIFSNARNTLPEEDREIPQLDAMLLLVKRGIGIHHGGLLPVLKEIVEILFGEGLIKCLFATETFSMGLNMPAKTVIFTSAHKYDGVVQRMLTSGEYIQMSGRAGRRGLDTNGNVILMMDKVIKNEDAKHIIKGDTEPLNSSFHLTYNMILNLMRIETISPEYLMKRSFFQFQNFAELPNLMIKLNDEQRELKENKLSKEEYLSIEKYFRLDSSLNATRSELWDSVRNVHILRPFLNPGRLVHVKYETKDFGWCILTSKLQINKYKSNFVECLVPVAHESIFATELSMTTPPSKSVLRPDGLILDVEINYIFELSSVVIDFKNSVDNILKNNDESRKDFLNKRNKILEKFKSIPLLNLKKDLKYKEDVLVKYEQRILDLESQLELHKLKSIAHSEEMINSYHRKIECETKIDQLTKEINKRISLIKMDELKSRKRILRQFKYCSESDVIETKGRIACEISTSDELMLTELMIGGDMSDIDEHQLVAFLSCFVFEEIVSDYIEPQEDLQKPLERMAELARHISRVSKECRLDVFPAINEIDYVNSFKPGLVEIVRAWSKGSSFSVLCNNTSVYEGSIIRSIRRLDELIGQLYEAARVIGNIQLEKKFAQASNFIKRGIIFASSLYLASGN